MPSERQALLYRIVLGVRETDNRCLAHVVAKTSRERSRIIRINLRACEAAKQTHTRICCESARDGLSFHVDRDTLWSILALGVRNQAAESALIVT